MRILPPVSRCFGCLVRGRLLGHQQRPLSMMSGVRNDLAARRHLVSEGPRAGGPVGLLTGSTFLQVRHYNLASQVPWGLIRKREMAKRAKDNRTRQKPHAESLNRFRLTRFGWERRRARLRGWKKRLRSSASKKQSTMIQFVHRHDMPKLNKVSTHLKLKLRDLPLKTRNLNMMASRKLLPAHLG
uniref:Uncharacterized protein n=1 Tax=Noctiluca scintillans TaxID=2966 RepID=A0A7S0ZPT4_NOCSC|mmetsp:Transcript_1370/g.3682  ORF Transcript_1370/g.3682 Transcript_1370/m.3682 type:complete len:185 (+) Transcript_1370:50-604(+)